MEWSDLQSDGCALTHSAFLSGNVLLIDPHRCMRVQLHMIHEYVLTYRYVTFKWRQSLQTWFRYDIFSHILRLSLSPQR